MTLTSGQGEEKCASDLNKTNLEGQASLSCLVMTDSL